MGRELIVTTVGSIGCQPFGYLLERDGLRHMPLGLDPLDWTDAQSAGLSQLLARHARGTTKLLQQLAEIRPSNGYFSCHFTSVNRGKRHHYPLDGYFFVLYTGIRPSEGTK